MSSAQPLPYTPFTGAVINFESLYVKTSTGFNKSGATFEVVKLMSDTVKDVCKVKAAGGVRCYADAIKMVNECGASRLGTSSGVAIMEGQVADKNQY